MAATGKKREERAARERTRAYTARQALHDRRMRRRRRDNVIAGIAGGVLVVLISLVQYTYYNQPTPASTETPSATDTAAPTSTATTEP